MSLPRWQSVASLVAALIAAVLVSYFLLGLSPRSQTVPTGTPVIEAGDQAIDGTAVEPYLALYSTRSKVLGVTVAWGTIEVRVVEAESGLEVTFDFGNATDSILVDRNTLAPIRRNIPGQRMTFEGSHLIVRVGSADSSRVVTLDYPGEVFEVSILDLVALVAAPAPPFQLGWANFTDEEGWLANVTEIGAETIVIPGGESFNTRILDIGFADGTVRRYWMASRPPYKIKQKTFDRGRSRVYSWDLESFQ